MGIIYSGPSIQSRKFAPTLFLPPQPPTLAKDASLGVSYSAPPAIRGVRIGGLPSIGLQCPYFLQSPWIDSWLGDKGPLDHVITPLSVLINQSYS